MFLCTFMAVTTFCNFRWDKYTHLSHSINGETFPASSLEDVTSVGSLINDLKQIGGVQCKTNLMKSHVSALLTPDHFTDFHCL